ncbi:MAG: hypothetical protein M1839_000183 [Geoglossum umbratile]|nr:MAG: hypothetical protein M1839_000183 [Geoglossum umbratile]
MGAATTNLLLLLSYTTLSTAITIPPNIDPKIFSVQPIIGGSADDCGDGHPVTLDEASWVANDVDSAIASVWSAGKPDPNFDFHQAFARKYGVSLYCSNIFSTCTGDPSACSALKGTVAEKKQGWLGIKALLNLQEQFLQFEKAMTQAANGLTVDLESFQKLTPSISNRFSSRQNFPIRTGTSMPGPTSGWPFSKARSVFSAVFTPDIGVTLATGAGTLIAGLISTQRSVRNDRRADLAIGPTDFSILTLSDARGAIKNSLLTGLDLAHNATFSNGLTGKYPGPERLRRKPRPQAYSRIEGNLNALIQRIMASKLLEATWSIQNTVLFRIGTVTDPEACAKWYPMLPDLRFCNGDKGLFVLRNVVQDGSGKMTISTPPGSDITAVASIGGYGIQLPDLLKSTSDRYMDHGLYDTDFTYFLPGILYGWQVSPPTRSSNGRACFLCLSARSRRRSGRIWTRGQEIHLVVVVSSPYYICGIWQNGMLILRFCNVIVKSVDQWGQKFLDYAPDLMKTYITSRTTC